MAESYVQIDEGTGKKLHTFARTVGANTIEDEVVVQGEPYLATYVVNSGALPVSVTNAHTLQLMAGASLNVRLHRILCEQDGLSAAAAMLRLQLYRLTTAGTGGTGITPALFNTADAASGAAAMSAPTVKGTEGAKLFDIIIGLVAAQPILNTSRYEWVAHSRAQSIIIPAGATNGLVLKVNTGIATSPTVNVTYEFTESNF